MERPKLNYHWHPESKNNGENPKNINKTHINPIYSNNPIINNMEPFSDDEVVFSEEPTHEFRNENREDGVLNQTDWIVLSSSFFSFPAIRELVIVTITPAKYNHTNQYLSILLILVSLVSINYWRKPEKG